MFIAVITELGHRAWVNPKLVTHVYEINSNEFSIYFLNDESFLKIDAEECHRFLDLCQAMYEEEVKNV